MPGTQWGSVESRTTLVPFSMRATNGVFLLLMLLLFWTSSLLLISSSWTPTRKTRGGSQRIVSSSSSRWSSHRDSIIPSLFSSTHPQAHPPPPQTKPYTLVSWNILGPAFATRTKYFYCDPQQLDWSVRRPVILEKLVASRADIICLQEVPTASFGSDFGDPLRPYNYSSVLQTVSAHHPSACAVLVRTAAFAVVATESRSRALILVLKRQLQPQPQQEEGIQPWTMNHTTTTKTTAPSNGSVHSDTENSSSTESLDNYLFLANVHLEAGNGQDDTRFLQIQSLLKRLDRHVAAFAGHQKEFKTRTRPEQQHRLQQQQQQQQQQPHILLSGDFNTLYKNPVYHLLSTGAWTGNSSILRRSSSSSSRLETTDSPTSPSSSLLPHQQKEPIYATTATPKSCLKWLPLTDIFRNSTNNKKQPQIQMTFVGGYVLDYIWSSWNNVCCPWIVDDRVLTKPTATRRRYVWPSEENPSDHLPIGASFHFETDNDDDDANGRPR